MTEVGRAGWFDNAKNQAISELINKETRRVRARPSSRPRPRVPLRRGN